MRESCWPKRLIGRTPVSVMLMLSLLGPCCFAQPTPATESVDILGADAFLPLLREQLQILRDSALNPTERQRLIALTPQHIKELLATEGFFSVIVSTSITVAAHQTPQTTTVRFHVTMGEATRIQTVDLHFIGAIEQDASRITALKKNWLLAPGQPFRQARWDAAKQQLLTPLLVRDFPAARLVDSRAEIDPVKHTAHLIVTIDSGPAFKFGPLEIHGLQRYPPTFIARSNMIREGEPFSQDRLAELQARVLDTGYFRSAFATIDPDPANAAQVPIRLEVTEVDSRRLGLGLGVSTDSGVRGQIKWLDRRFLDRNWRLESVLRVDRQIRLLGGELYFEPLQQGLYQNMLAGWLPSVESTIARSTITGEEIEKIRTSARLSTPSRSDERVLSVSLLVDRRTLPGLDTLSRRALIGGYTLVRRQFDSPLAPRRGYMAGIELQAGVGGVLNENNIGRVLLQGIWLRPLNPHWHTVLRLQAGRVFFSGDAQGDRIPEDLLFRTGGDQTVRGYAFGSLGVPKNGAIVGGNVMALMSVELAYQITPQWAVAVFSDAGDAAATRRDFRLRYGSGIGARWRSPVGQMNVDLARGHETGETRLHFSVGYGF